MRLALATRSTSSFFLMAYELEEPLAALMSSSARHSAIVFMLRKADNAGRPDAGGVLTGARVHHGIDDDLDGVLVRQQVDDLHRVLHDAHRHELLAVVPAVHHEGAGEALHDGALRLAEALGLVAAGRVRHEHGVLGLDRNVVLQRDVLDLRRWRAGPASATLEPAPTREDPPRRGPGGGGGGGGWRRGAPGPAPADRRPLL